MHMPGTSAAVRIMLAYSVLKVALSKASLSAGSSKLFGFRMPERTSSISSANGIAALISTTKPVPNLSLMC